MEKILKPVSPSVKEVYAALNDPNKYVIVQTAPSVRVALGELFNLPIGTKVTGKMVASLRRLGFKAVFDTDLGADITIWEESNEFLQKVLKGGPFPQFTSCCIGWINMAGKVYKDTVLPLLSTTKSPIGCLGSVAKTFYANRINVKPENIVDVAVVPCVLKTQENKLPYNKTNNIPDVDICITTKDLGVMIENASIDFNSLPDEDFDNPLGESTGGGTIFGRSGGVMEAAIRNAIYLSTKEKFTSKIEFKPSSFSPDIQEAEVVVANKKLLVCHCGMMGVRKIVDLIKANQCPYHFVEVMACPGGCIMGAGQPMHMPKEVLPAQVKLLRTKGLNDIDESQEFRISALNKSIQEVYNEIFDGKPGSEKAEHDLHRDYSINQ